MVIVEGLIIAVGLFVVFFLGLTLLLISLKVFSAIKRIVRVEVQVRDETVSQEKADQEAQQIANEIIDRALSNMPPPATKVERK